VGGALLGFAVGRGSSASGSFLSSNSGDVTPVLDRRVAANGDLPAMAPSNAHQTGAADVADAAGVALGSLPPPDEPQPPTIARSSSPRPQADRVGAVPSSGEQTTETAKPSFYEELEYLKRAQSALRQGNGALALGLMTSLDSIQPGGALLSERGVAKVLAHCQLGDVESAERVAERLADTDMASVYAERLENSCASAVFSNR
jgi:hypothetical protein